MGKQRGWMFWAVLGIGAAILVAGVALWVTAWRFEQGIAGRVAAIRRAPATAEVERGLPPPIREHLARSEFPAAAGIGWVRIAQRGQMRLGPDKPWMDFTAVQHYAVARSGFVWRARMAMSGVPVVVLDALGEGGGRLEARLLGAVPVARAAGPDATGAQLLRYLSEVVWMPPAVAGNPQIAWEPVDDRQVRGRIRHGETEVALEFTFDAAGDIVEVAAPERMRMVDGRTEPTPWGGAFGDYREVNGVRIPTRGRGWWELPEGRFEYWRGEVTAITWGPPEQG